MVASDLLNRVLDAASDAGDVPADASCASEADVLACLDEIRAMVVGDLEGALAALDRVERLVGAIGSDRARSRLGAVRGHALNYASRYREAARAATEAAELAESIGDADQTARAHMVLVHAHAKLGRLDEALRCALRAERAFAAEGDLTLAAQALCNAGIVTRMQGNAEEAIDLFERALGLTEHEPATRAQMESGLAEVYLDTGRYAEGEAAFIRSAETFEAEGVRRAASIVRGSLADLYGRQGRLSAAIEQFEVARRFFEADRATGELGRILTEQADVYATTGLVDDAARGYRRAGELLEQAGAVQERARSLLGLGRVLAARNPDAAAESLDESARLSEQAGNNAARAIARLHRARLDLSRGVLDGVEGALDDAASALEGWRNESLLCTMTRVDLHLGRGEHGLAEQVASATMDEARGLGHSIYHAELLWRRAVARRALGRSADALADLREAVGVIERIRGTLQGSRFRAGLLGSSRTVFEETVGLLIERGKHTEAFEVTERARGRTLLDLLGGNAEAEPPVHAGDETTLRLLHELADARAELNAVYSGHDPGAPGEAHRAWFASLQSAEGRVTALETRVRSSGRAREFLGVPESFARIADELGGDALVSYWFDRGTLVGFVLREGRVETCRLGVTDDDADAMIQEVMFQIRRGLVRGPGGAGGERRARACREELARLHAAIWAPLAGGLEGAGRVSVVPAGPLHAVPFGALHDGDRFLIETREPLLLPTASVLPILRRGSAPFVRTVSVLAVPDEHAPDIEAEAAALREAIPGADVLIGDRATSEAAMSRAGDSAVLHLACHGAFPPSNPMAAGLKLADRWVTVRDVLSWRLPGSVVVLSGCDTGRQSLDAGEELFGFARGFFAAGARGLVMSLWRAHDRAASALMTDTYRALGQIGGSGTGPGTCSSTGSGDVRSALVAAQRSQISAGVHPAFWSNFFYMGA